MENHGQLDNTQIEKQQSSNLFSSIYRNLQQPGINSKDEAFVDPTKFYRMDLKSYNDFLNKVDRWYTTTEHKYLKYMAFFEQDIITKSEFILTLRNMKSPFNDKELKEIYKMLDPEDTKQVEYGELQNVIWRSLTDKFMREDRQRTMNLEKPNQWILVSFRLPNFELPPNLATSFKQLIDLSYTGSMLRQLITLKIPILPTGFIIIFTDPMHYSASIIAHSETLEDLQFKGGTKCVPGEATLYYEFSSGSIDCPILISGNNLEKTKYIKPRSDELAE